MRIPMKSAGDSGLILSAVYEVPCHSCRRRGHWHLGSEADCKLAADTRCAACHHSGTVGPETVFRLGTQIDRNRIVLERHPPEPPRVCRGLHSLRRWSYDEEDIKSIFP
jgi:hypothetical protein